MQQKKRNMVEVHLKIALAHKGLSIKKYALQLGVTDVAIHRVIRGQLKSEKLSKRIESFITDEFRQMNLGKAA